MTQIDTIEASIGRKWAILRRWLVRARCIPITCSWNTHFSVEISGEALNYGFGLPGWSVTPHVDSDKLRNELHSKMPWESEARHETQTRWELEGATSDTLKSNNMCIFGVFDFDLFYVRQENRQKILLSFWNKVVFCRMFLLLLERDPSVIRSSKTW